MGTATRLGFMLAGLGACAAAPAADWSTLGLAGPGRHCSSHESGCQAVATTRYGSVRVATTPTATFRLTVGDKLIRTFEGESVTIEGTFTPEGSDNLLLSLTTGGMACPIELYILRLAAGAPPTLSRSFGTCSELYRARVEGGALLIEEPIYFDPQLFDEQNEELRKARARGPDTVVYRWSGSQLTEEPARPRE